MKTVFTNCTGSAALVMRSMLGLVLMMATALSMAQSSPSPYTAASRSMWLWYSADAISNTGTAQSDLFAFCASPFGFQERRITHLYLYAHQQVSQSPMQLRQFLSAAHGQGLTVFYLDGEPTWAESESQRLYGEQVLRNVLAFNSNSLPHERFDGVQYDVEPYGLPNWSIAKIAYWSQYITLLSNCQAQVNYWNSTNNASIPFEACIPRWYDSDSDTVTNSEQVQDITDSIAIMDYVNTAERIIADATTEVAYADFIEKKAVIGVETMQVDPSTATFFGKTNSEMEGELWQVVDAYSSINGFGGLAIHHYDSYRLLAPGEADWPEADIGVTLAASTAAPVLRKSMTYTATASNSGPITAEAVNIAIQIPLGFTISGVTSSQGTFSVSGKVVTCTAGSIQTGATAALTVTVSPTKTGLATAEARASSSTPDPQSINNTASLTVRVAKK